MIASLHRFPHLLLVVTMVIVTMIATKTPVCRGHVVEDDPGTEHWHVHAATLLKPISDHTATLDAATGKIYIVGGCNSTAGNRRAAVPNSTEFFCADVTDAASIFDARAGTVVAMAPAPRPRYRHASILHDGLIWLLGGRDASFNETAMVDNLVYEVDVYDTTAGRWRDDLAFRLDETIARSDHAAFVIDDTIYLVGGYELGYNATPHTFAIDIPSSLNSATTANRRQLSWTAKSDLIQERGDCAATIVDGVAYVIGGFTHEDQWCMALDDVERYRPDDDAWERLAGSQSLKYARGDKAVVTVGTKMYVIGGESKTDCSLDPSQRTNPTTEVEVFDTADGDAAGWTEEIADIPNDHFRFPAVSYGGTIYTFGGQNYYNAECDCFPTSNVILTFDTTAVDDDNDEKPEDTKTTTNSSGAPSPYVSMMMMILVVAFSASRWLVL